MTTLEEQKKRIDKKIKDIQEKIDLLDEIVEGLKLVRHWLDEIKFEVELEK